MTARPINPPGGGNLVACWMLQALCDDHDVTLFTWTPPDLARMQSLLRHVAAAGRLRGTLAPAVARMLGRASPSPMALLKGSYVHYPRLDLHRPPNELR